MAGVEAKTVGRSGLDQRQRLEALHCAAGKDDLFRITPMFNDGACRVDHDPGTAMERLEYPAAVELEQPWIVGAHGLRSYRLPDGLDLVAEQGPSADQGSAGVPP